MKQGASLSARLGLCAGCVIAASTFGGSAVASQAGSPVQLTPQTFDTELYSVTRIAFSHDNHRVAFLGYAGPNSRQELDVTVFDVRTGRLIKSLPVPNASFVILKGGVAFSPDDSRLAAGANEITIWDTRSWTEVAHAPGPFEDGPFGGDDLLGLAYAPDGGQIVAAYGKVWGPGVVHVRNREVFIRLSEAVRRSAGDGKAPHTYERPEIQVFNASNGALLKRFAIVRDGRLGTGVRITSGLIVSRDGRAAYLAVRDFEGLSGLPPRIAIERIDLNSGAVAALFEHRQPDEFTALAVNSDQSLVATGEAVGNKQGWRGPDGAWVTHETTDPVRLWNARDGSPHADLGPSAGAVRRLLFLPDGSRVIACQTDNQSHNLMAIWDPKAKVLAAVVRVVTPRPVDVSCALSQDGRHAILTVPTDGPSGASMPEKAYMVDPLSTAR